MILSAIFEAIDREKPEKFRKLQEATRSAQALVDQLTSGKGIISIYIFISIQFSPLDFQSVLDNLKLALVLL